MTADQIIELLKARVGDLQVHAVEAVDVPTLVVRREQILAVLNALRDDPALHFMHLADLTATDSWPGEPRFHVVYHVTSIEHRVRVRLKVPLAGEDARLSTVTGLWPGANWLEREVFDLFGIIFEGHPDLRRVLMPEDWEGYPLRKDYPVQIKLPVKIYEPLELSAEEYQKNIENDRRAREAITGSRRRPGEEVNAAQGDTARQTKLTRE